MNPLCIIPFLCLFAPMPPSPVVPDGYGGYVPFTNSRVMPDGSLRPYDPTLDGVMSADGSVVYPFAPPPPPMPQGHVDVGPPMVMPAQPDYPPEAAPYQGPQARPRHDEPQRHAAKPYRAPGAPNGACYGPDGRPVEPIPPGCETGSAPPMRDDQASEPDRDRRM